MGLDQWEQGAVRRHNEGRARFFPAPAEVEGVVCDGDADVVDAGGQMG